MTPTASNPGWCPRALIVLLYYVGLPVARPRWPWACQVGTVKSRLHRTTQQMRATLDADARVSFTRAAGDMTNRVDFDRRLASWLDEDVAPHAPGELAIIDRQSQVQATIPDADGSAPSWQHLGG